MFEFIRAFLQRKTSIANLVKEGALIVDVRSTGEYHVGHIEGSWNIPLESIKRAAGSSKELDRTIVTVCSTGNRSDIAKLLLSNAGIKAYNGGSWADFKNKIQSL